jgi:hypothetical protein
MHVSSVNVYLVGCITLWNWIIRLKYRATFTTVFSRPQHWAHHSASAGVIPWVSVLISSHLQSLYHASHAPYSMPPSTVPTTLNIRGYNYISYFSVPSLPVSMGPSPVDTLRWRSESFCSRERRPSQCCHIETCTDPPTPRRIAARWGTKDTQWEACWPCLCHTLEYSLFILAARLLRMCLYRVNDASVNPRLS